MKLDYKQSKKPTRKVKFSCPEISTNLLLTLAVVTSLLSWGVYSFQQKNALRITKVSAPVSTTQELSLRELSHKPKQVIPPAPKPTSAHWHTVKVKPGQNLSVILAKFDIENSAILEMLNAGKNSKMLRNLKPNQEIKLLVENKELLKLETSLGIDKTLQISKDKNSYIENIDKKDIETRLSYASAVIDNSLFLAGLKANISENVIMQLADIFAWDIDFALDIRPNDSFKILYEEHYIDGKLVKAGPIVAAWFSNNNHTYKAYRYLDSHNNPSYYDENGKNVKGAFIRTPVKFSRISSHFTLGRNHPILHKIRAHRGVDYAAPRGTPVKASGNGKVVFVGKKGGYGNAVILQHGKKYSTLYAHLSKFDKKIKVGSKVKQGQVIAYVGSTGLATGPHLHYEFRVDGVHKNPLTVKLPRDKPLSGEEKALFLAKTEDINALIGKHEQFTIAQNNDEQ